MKVRNLLLLGFAAYGGFRALQALQSAAEKARDQSVPEPVQSWEGEGGSLASGETQAGSTLGRTGQGE